MIGDVVAGDTAFPRKSHKTASFTSTERERESEGVLNLIEPEPVSESVPTFLCDDPMSWGIPPYRVEGVGMDWNGMGFAIARWHTLSSRNVEDSPNL